MRIAQALAGFSLGQADVLRKAMGKKDPKVMAKQREAFMAGARAKGVSEKKADEDLRPDGVLRRLRLQQVALDRLRVPGLPDRVPQGELPVALRGGAADHRVAEHRQAGDLPGRVPRARRAGAGARHQRQPAGTSRWSPAGACGSAGGDQGAGRGRRQGDCRGRERRSAAASPRCTQLCEILDLRIVNKRVFEALVKSGACDALGGGTDGPAAARRRARRLFASIDARLRARQPDAARQGSGPGGSVRRRRRRRRAPSVGVAAGRAAPGPRSSS